jgi:hypothetical protein
MIKDMGFTIQSDVPIDQLLQQTNDGCEADMLKGIKELRPFK